MDQRVSGKQSIMAMNQPSETPALTPPPGVIPDFVHPASIRKYNILCQAICLPLSTIFVCMRMYTRSYVSRNLGAEDCILLSLHSLSSSGLISNRYLLCRMGKTSSQVYNKISKVANTSSQLGLISYAIICLESDKYGAGVHEWDVSKSNGRKWAYVCGR